MEQFILTHEIIPINEQYRLRVFPQHIELKEKVEANLTMDTVDQQTIDEFIVLQTPLLFDLIQTSDCVSDVVKAKYEL